MKNIFSLETRFVSEEFKDFECFLKDIAHCAEGLKTTLELSDRKIEIYIEDAYCFSVAFFASLLADFEIFILPRSLPSGECYFLNDVEIEKVFKNLKLSAQKENFVLNVEKEFFIQTSGSSGERKNIVKSVKQMLQEANFLKEHYKITSKHCFFSSASHQHLYGLTFKIFLPLVCGSEIVCKNLNYPEMILEFLDSKHCANHLIFLSSPVLLEAIIRHKNVLKFGCIEKIFTAGSKLDTQNHKKLIDILNTTEIIEIYGSTETGVIAYNLGYGFTIFEVVMASCDENMRLVAKSPWQLGSGGNGFLTSDCVELKERSLKILGRYDRIVKLHDRRISLDGIESLLKNHIFVQQVVIRQDERYNRLSALVILSKEGEKQFRVKGKKGIVNALKECLKENFPNKVRYFYLREKLPYDAQGKISKQDFMDCIYQKNSPKFEVLHNDEKLLKARAKIALDCFYFDGHFLSFPLVPGFVELSYVYALIEAYWEMGFACVKEVESVKFMCFLRPKDELNVEIEKRENKIYFKMFANDKECANGRLRFE